MAVKSTNQSINKLVNQCEIFRGRVACPTVESAQANARAQEIAFTDVMGTVVLDRFEEAPKELAENRTALDQIAKQVQNPVGKFFTQTLATSYGAWAGVSTKSVELTAGLPIFVGAVVSGDVGAREMLVGMRDMGVHAYHNLDQAWEEAKAGRLSEAAFLASAAATDFAMLAEGAAGAARLTRVGFQKAQAVGEAMAKMAGGGGGALATVTSAGSMSTLPAGSTAVAVASAGASDVLPVVIAMASEGVGNAASESSGLVNRAVDFNQLRSAVKSLPENNPGRQLIESMARDQFGPHHAPFTEVPAVDFLQEILRQGVERFERSTYRTIGNVKCWNNGYDFVQYTIYHPNSGVPSVVRASRYGKPTRPMGIGMPESRELFFEFAVEGRYVRYGGRTALYRFEGDPAEIRMGMQQFIDDSVEARGMFVNPGDSELVRL